MLHRFKLGFWMVIAKLCDGYAVQKHHQTRATSDQKGKPAMGNLLTAGVARPEGFEPPAFRIGICCDIQLRHGRVSNCMPC